VSSSHNWRIELTARRDTDQEEQFILGKVLQRGFGELGNRSARVPAPTCRQSERTGEQLRTRKRHWVRDRKITPVSSRRVDDVQLRELRQAFFG
jgi:hypothetical protein